MINKILTTIFGTSHERTIKKLKPLVQAINDLEAQWLPLSDQELQSKAQELKKKATKDTVLEEMLPTAFSLCREAADRRLGMLNIFKESVDFDWSQLSPSMQQQAKEAQNTIQEKGIQELFLPAKFYAELRALHPESRWPYRMRCFDVQLMGGVVLNYGQIAEMKTGEGKTLVATLAVYLNALLGKGVHVITTNDYLAKTGAQENSSLYQFLGLTVGIVTSDTPIKERKKSYNCDVTYGTNNEFGFDYLRDNMVHDADAIVQRPLHFAIVDEVDSILIDEARTPLIISGPAEESTNKYGICNRVVRNLKKEVHYTTEEKSKHVSLTEEGINVCEKQLGLKNLYADLNTEWVHHITQALRAHVFFNKEVDYIVKTVKLLL